MVVGRFRELYRWAKVPPEGVEKASRPERFKRDAWMIVSTIVSMFAGFAVVFLVFTPLDWMGVWEPSGTLGAMAVFAVWIVAWALIDLWLFSWGVGYYDLVPPWQFRVEQEADDA